jgi:hypothetical protein
VQAETFDLMGSKVIAFFVQVSGVRKGAAGKNKGDIWVVANTLKASKKTTCCMGGRLWIVEPPAAR